MWDHLLWNAINLKEANKIQISFDGETLETKSCVKYLGLYFDSLLSWKKQISDAKRKINFKLSKIRPLAKFLDHENISLLIKAFILPYIHYCSTTYHSAAPSQIKKLQSVCNKIDLMSPNSFHISVQDRLNNDLAILTFKMIHHLAPSYLSNKIDLTSSRHTYNTRQARNNGVFHIHNINSFTSKSIKFSIPILCLLIRLMFLTE